MYMYILTCGLADIFMCDSFVGPVNHNMNVILLQSLYFSYILVLSSPYQKSIKVIMFHYAKNLLTLLCVAF